MNQPELRNILRLPALTSDQCLCANNTGQGTDGWAVRNAWHQFNFHCAGSQMTDRIFCPLMSNMRSISSLYSWHDGSLKVDTGNHFSVVGQKGAMVDFPLHIYKFHFPQCEVNSTQVKCCVFNEMSRKAFSTRWISGLDPDQQWHDVVWAVCALKKTSNTPLSYFSSLFVALILHSWALKVYRKQCIFLLL